jgi:Tfp pilus assembly protein PilZ
MEKDLRKNERVIISLEVVIDFSSGKQEVRISDISMSGCFIDTTAPVKKGEIIFFNVCMPTGEWLKISGEVAYILPNSGFGLRFTDLSAEGQKLLKQLISGQ